MKNLLQGNVEEILSETGEEEAFLLRDQDKL